MIRLPLMSAGLRPAKTGSRGGGGQACDGRRLWFPLAAHGTDEGVVRGSSRKGKVWLLFPISAEVRYLKMRDIFTFRCTN